MGIANDITADWAAALAALAWQYDMGVDEVIGESPSNAYELPDRAGWQKSAAAVIPQAPAQAAAAQTASAQTDPSQTANATADTCRTLEDLRAALDRFQGLDFKKGARSMVFGAGHPNADVLILGDAPNREDERAALPFADSALLHQIFALIGLTRDAPDPAQALYLTCALPWRTPQDRPATPEELAIIRPFVAKHIELVSPKIVVLMGNAALHLGLNTTGILRARGQWGQAFGRRAMPMLTPNLILQSAESKRDTWADLLAIKSALR